MILIDCKQGSPEWFWNRLGIPTASNFSRILTPKTRKFAAGSETYMHELLSEWLTGIPHGAESSGFMERGSLLEQSAVSWYELVRNVTTEPVGVCMSDDRRMACSPDRIVSATRGLEIKVPSAKVHVANLLDMTEDHFAQAQGCMMITGLTEWDLLSWHPEIPSKIVSYRRDDEYIRALSDALAQFNANLLSARARLLAMGCEPATELDPQFVASLASFVESEAVTA